MIAAEQARRHGRALLGRRVLTVPFSDWPGGAATVMGFGDDPAAPEIVLRVSHDETGEKIGVFDFEPLQLLRRRPAPLMPGIPRNART